MWKSKVSEGFRSGKLVIVKRDSKDWHGNIKWLCQCDCGNQCVVASYHLTRGDTVSCGCWRRERPKTDMAREASRKANTTHGKSKTRRYNIYTKGKARCRNVNCPDYKNYGGRGILWTWETFEEFDAWCEISGYSDDLTIERKDVNGNYCPSNCTWIPKPEQNKNTRKTERYEGKLSTEWSRELGLDRGTIWHYKTRNGCTLEQAVEHFKKRRKAYS